MVEQILLGSSSFAGVREIGGFGQPLHLLYPQIRAVLSRELGPEAATMLAEPVVDRVGNRIDWYTQGDPDNPPSALTTLPDDQRQAVHRRIDEFLQRARDLAEGYAASADPRRVQLGALLQAVLHPPAESDLFLVHNQPVIIGWAFALDRPWDMAAGQARSPAPPVTQPVVAPPRNVATLPNIAVPELASAAALASASPPAVEPPPKRLPSELPPPPPIPPQEPAASFPESPPQELTASGVAVKPTMDSASIQRDEGGKSRWLWWLIALIVLLALLAAYWWANDRSPSPVATATPEVLPVAEPERASSRPAQPSAVQPLATDGRTPPERLLESAPAALPDKRPETSPVSSVSAGETGSGRAAVSPATTGGPSTQTPIPARAPITGRPDAASAPPALGSLPLADSGSQATASPSPATATSGPPAAEKSSLQTLEEALEGRESAPPAASPKPQWPVAPPIKAEPTPEERREFASRMSATGAATGEITATLLWNSPGDLDLLVRCPSGQQLDYRTPAECGGALDVDANANRASLSARPVENAFWPAGKAAPGNYEIAVRYAPRKDEQNPQETPFQVRLIRGGQESVFKGVVRPNTVTPVTTFTVQR